MERLHRRIVLLILVGTGLALAGWFGSTQLSLADLVRHEQSLRSVILERPARTWVVGFALYFLAALVPGTRGKAIVAGWMFGFWPALVLVNLALTAAAEVTFFASRHLVRELVQARYAGWLVHADRILEREGAWYVILLRVVPISFSLTNYLLGATRLNGVTYWWATQLGLLPGNVVFVFVGTRLPSLSQLAEHGIWAVFSRDMLLALVVLSLFPFLVDRLVRWRRRCIAPPPGV
jgi:uncharacterized membrane protein YdjX (TVP38/TMEM64 family)